MKLIGYLKGSGKLGNIVVSRVAGETIARDYNPNVSNPNTVAQVNQRARMKLASQLAAALSPVIVISREGLVSARNKWISLNMDYIYGNNGVAQVSYENIQLTKGNGGLPRVTAQRGDGNTLALSLAESADAAVSQVVYVVYLKTAENKLQYVGRVIQEEAGEDGTFPASITNVDGDLIIWAYGMKATTAKAKAKYNNYEVKTGQDLATLLMNRQIAQGDFQFTETRGATLFAGDNSTAVVGDNQSRVFITASGPGSVAGADFTNGRRTVDNGTSVTVTATPNSGCTFLGWKVNGETSYISTSAEYQFTVQSNVDLIAEFNDPNSSNGDGGGDYGF